MHTSRHIPASALTPLQWFARIVSVPVFGLWLFLLLMLGTNTEDFIPTAIPFMCAITGALISVLAAWRWEVWGGIALILSTGVVWTTDRYLITIINPQAPFVSFALPSLLSLSFFVTGLLFLIAHRRG